MFGLPESTCLRKQIPKTVIYEKFAGEMSPTRKKSFENDISRIFVINEISPASIRINEGDRVKAIFGVLVELKSGNFDEKNILLLPRLFGQHLLIILHENDKYKLAVYQTKLFQTEWYEEDEIALKLDGLDLDKVWQNLVIRMSGIIPQNGHTLEEQIIIEEEKDKLRKQIKELETKAGKEQQSKKKYELHQRITEYKKRMEEM